MVTMDENVLQHYLQQVPAEIREAVMELDTPLKWAIYIALTVDGDRYFNQLKNEFRANPNTINIAVKSLVASGLVARKVPRIVDAGDANKTYYTATKLGEKLLTNLLEVVLPPLAVGEIQGIRIPSQEATRRIEFVRGSGTTDSYPVPELQKSIHLMSKGVQT
jgi:DNA-binding HxlR family transcriptional regulator